jgi:hypothetical protein
MAEKPTIGQRQHLKGAPETNANGHKDSHLSYFYRAAK